jgi:hypothetical protein
MLKLFLFILFSCSMVYSVDVNFIDCGSILGPIDTITASVWYPEPGQELIMNSFGTAKENISNGTYNIKLYYSSIEISNESGDLCSLLYCPITQGSYTIKSKSVFPANTPNGNYMSVMTTKTSNNTNIFCTKISFDI